VSSEERAESKRRRVDDDEEEGDGDGSTRPCARFIELLPLRWVKAHVLGYKSIDPQVRLEEQEKEYQECNRGSTGAIDLDATAQQSTAPW
jgi:hypothetical protein